MSVTNNVPFKKYIEKDENTIKNPNSNTSLGADKITKPIEVRIHIPKTVRNRQEKINRIYDILKPKTV